MLSDPEKRRLYDMYGSAEFEKRYSTEDIFRGFDFESVFRDLGIDLGSFFRRNRRGGKTFIFDLSDLFSNLFGTYFGEEEFSPFGEVYETVQLDLPLTLEEVMKGWEKEVILPGTYETIKIKIPQGIKDGQILRIRKKSGRKSKEYLFKVRIISQSGYKVEDGNIFIEKEAELIRPSILFEDFILKNKIINWSQTNTDAIIYINDKENNFGDLEISKLKVKYIETDGFVENIDVNNLKLSENFGFIDIYFNGLNEDSLDKIKKTIQIKTI